MTKKELQEYYWVRKNIKQLEEKLLELETEVTRQTTRLSDEPKSANNTQDKLASIVTEIVSVQEEINKKLKRAYAIAAKIENAIAELPEREQYLIRARYIELKSWEQIAVDMKYSWRQVHRIHANALRLLAQDGTLCHTGS